MSDDGPTLVKFKIGWEHDGTGPDGLPYYRPTTLIRLDRPPYLSVERVADDVDKNDYQMPYQLFLKEQAARKQSYAEGYPLCLWPAVNEAEFVMLVDRDVTTVEQLAKLDRRSLPAELAELSNRAAKLINLQKGAAKYEELLTEREGRIAALEEQVRDASLTIANLKATVDSMRVRGNSMGLG